MFARFLEKSRRSVCKQSLALERLEERLLLASSVWINNGLSSSDPDYFAVEVGWGGGAHNSSLGGSDTLYEYLGYLHVNGRGGSNDSVHDLYDFGSDPGLSGGAATSYVTINPPSGGSIVVDVRCEIIPDSQTMVTTYDFTASGGADLRNAAFFQYMDSDIGYVGDDVLHVAGSVAGDTLILTTIEQGTSLRQAQRIGETLSSAQVTGFAADRWDDLRYAIVSGTLNPTPSGWIDTGSLPPGSFPGIGSGYGPADITTAIEYEFTSSTHAVIRTTLGSGEPVDPHGPRITSSENRGELTAPVSYIDVTFDESIDSSTFTSADVGVMGPSGAILTSVLHQGGNTYRISFSGQSTPGGYTVTVGPYIKDQDGNFMNQDEDGTNGEATADRYSASFSIGQSDDIRPTANLSSPVDGESVHVSTLNEQGYINVTFSDSGGSGLKASSITDYGQEFGLSGSGVGTASIDGTATYVSGSYRYHFTGSFTTGPVSVSFISGSFSDNDYNWNLSETESFTVTADPDSDGPYIISPTDRGELTGPVRHLDVTFNESVDDGTFTWIDALLSGPGGSISTSVTPQGGETYRIGFADLTRPGDYELTVGPYIEDEAGNYMDESYTATFSIPNPWGNTSVTVLTHGYAALGVVGGPQSFDHEGGEAIYERLVDDGMSAEWYIYQPGSGRIIPQEDVTDPDHKVIVFDWQFESDDFAAGYDEAAGDALFAMLMEHDLVDSDYLHLIGHSRGTIVNSEAAQRLLWHGKQVHQMTILDTETGPWPLNKAGVARAWNGIGYSDNYYGSGTWWQLHLLRGAEVDGSSPHFWEDADHSDVLEEYCETIPTGEEHPAYVGGGGFFYRTEPNNRKDPSGPRRPLEAPPTVINGNFEYLDFFDSFASAGWRGHGGERGALTMDEDEAGNWVLALDPWNTFPSATHNRLYVPEGIGYLEFMTKVTDSSSNDVFNVTITDTDGYSETISDSVPLGTESGWTYRAVNINEYAGEVITFEFALDAPGAFNVRDSVVLIDDVAFVVRASTPRGDIDGNGVIDAADEAAMDVAWGTGAGDVNWDSTADLDCDGRVGTGDYAILSGQWSGIASGIHSAVYGPEPLPGGVQVFGSGKSASSAGDVNGDSYDGMLIGARGANSGGGNAAGETDLALGRGGESSTAEYVFIYEDSYSGYGEMDLITHLVVPQFDAVQLAADLGGVSATLTNIEIDRFISTTDGQLYVDNIGSAEDMSGDVWIERGINLAVAGLSPDLSILDTTGSVAGMVVPAGADATFVPDAHTLTESEVNIVPSSFAPYVGQGSMSFPVTIDSDMDLVIASGGLGFVTIVRTAPDYTAHVIVAYTFILHETAPARISGVKFNDLNGNAQKDAGEPGLSGWTIFLDTNANGVLDPHETSATTAADGSYAFAGLDAGTYTVTHVPQADWVQTHPTSGSHGVTLAGGQNRGNVDFGSFEVDEPHILSHVPSVWMASPAADQTPTIAWTPVPGAFRYFCSVDVSTPANETSETSWVSAPLSAGSHTAYVQAEDADGNLSEIGSVEFTVGTGNLDVTLVAVLQASGSDARSALPLSVAELESGDTFFIEAWVRNAGGSNAGITGGYLDFSFEPALVSTGSIHNSPLYNVFPEGAVSAGLVDDLGGNAALGVTDMGDDEWVRVGYASFQAAAGGQADFTPAEGKDAFAHAGQGSVLWSNVDMTAASVLIVEPYRVVEEFVGPGGQTVTVLDMDEDADIDPGDVKVAFGWTGSSVQSIIIGSWNSGPMSGLAILVSHTSNVGTILDMRGARAGDLAFLESDAAVEVMLLNSGVAGYNVNGQTFAGIATAPQDADGDGDTTDLLAIHVNGKLGTSIINGEIAGDVVTEGLGLLLTRGGGLSGDLVFTGDGGPIILDGDLTGRVETDGGLSYVAAQNVTDAEFDLGGRLGFLSVTGAWTNSTLNASQLDGMIVAGDFDTGQVNTTGDLGFASLKSVENASFEVGGRLNFVSVTGAWTNSSLHANQLGFVSVSGQLSAMTPDLYDIHADNGYFFLLENRSFHLMNYPGYPGSETDTTINNVRVWVG
jgi:SdrD B-like protein